MQSVSQPVSQSDVSSVSESSHMINEKPNSDLALTIHSPSASPLSVLCVIVVVVDDCFYPPSGDLSSVIHPNGKSPSTLLHQNTPPPPQSLTLQCFALHQIQVVRLLEDSALESTAKTLQISSVNVEHESGHCEQEAGVAGG